jgi:hypothetical protein
LQCGQHLVQFGLKIGRELAGFACAGMTGPSIKETFKGAHRQDR